jgi:TonB-linked SusC/RagA family outer membrane protein
MKRIVMLFVVLCFIGLQAGIAQMKSVTGTVTSADDGLGMPGVSVVVKGTTTGTSTDIDGRFSIMASSTDVIVFSFVGMKQQEITVGDQTVINVVMQSETVGMEEVVVVAYGTQKKRDLTSSVANVKAEDLDKMSVVSFENAISGQTAGVQVSTGSRAGEANTIRIRGTSSVSASSQPLYVIDGVPQGDYIMGYTGNNTQISPLSSMNPADIESVQVLKDASASALYGSRASNGVVLITTKTGRKGATKISVDYSLGFQRETDFMDVLNGSEFTELFNEAYFNTFGVEKILGEPEDAINTDWLDAATRTGVVSNFNVSASGGNEKTTFYAGFSHQDEEGYTKGNNFKRITIRTNLEHLISEYVKFGINLSLSKTVNDRSSNNNSVSSVSTSGVLQYPNIPIFGDGSDLFGEEGTFYLGNGINPFNNIAYNLLNEIDQNIHEAVTVRPTVNGFAEIKILDDLKFKTDLSYDYVDLYEKIFFGVNSGDGGGSNGVSQALTFKRDNIVTTSVLTYSKVFKEDHNFDALLGYSYEQTTRNEANVTGQDFPDNSLYTINSAAEISGGGSSITKYSLESYFSRFRYNYQQKYLFEFSIRRDGSSRFGKDERYAVFPAFSAGWIASDEDFMEKYEWLSLAKLRLSYGITGNAEFLSSTTNPNATGANFPSRGLYGTGANYNGNPGLSPTQLQNPGLKWEQTRQFDIGLNLGFLDDRIAFEVDYYIKKTKDLLLSVRLPSTSGYTEFADNVGKLENKGFEFGLNTRNLVGDFKWSTSFNLSFNRNEITDLEGQIVSNGISQAREGEPIGVFYTVPFAGVDPDTGEALFYDLDGNKTTTYSDEFRRVVGDPNPDYTGGITNNFSYKGIDLSVLIQFVQGNDIYWDAGRFAGNSQSLQFNNVKSQLGRWQKPGDITNIPKAELFNGPNRSHSSRFIQDGSFVRIKNITLGYTLPKKVAKQMYLNSVRVYVTAQNWFTFTDYDGHDPEVSSNGTVNVGQGRDFFQAPPSKRFVFGVKIDL